MNPHSSPTPLSQGREGSLPLLATLPLQSGGSWRGVNGGGSGWGLHALPCLRFLQTGGGILGGIVVNDDSLMLDLINQK
jgi:hypothetical protein